MNKLRTREGTARATSNRYYTLNYCRRRVIKIEKNITTQDGLHYPAGRKWNQNVDSCWSN